MFIFAELLPRGSMGPDMLVGGEQWHRGLPSDWVPIIARDMQRQAEEGQQVTDVNHRYLIEGDAASAIRYL